MSALVGDESKSMVPGEQADYDDGHGTRYLTGMATMWVDTEHLFILRHETDNGRFVAQVDALDWDARVPSSLLTFTPPAGSHRFDPSTASTVPPPWRGTSVLLPSYVPPGVSSGQTEQSGNGQGDARVVIHYLSDALATRPEAFAIEEQIPSQGLSASVLALPRVFVQGRSMYRGTESPMAFAP